MNFCSGAWDVLCGSSLWWVEGWQQDNKPDTYHGTGKLWRRVSDPFFFPAASSLTQHLVVESLMLPVVPQTTSYKPLPAFVEGSTPGILKKQQYLHVSVRNQGSSQLKSPSWTKMCHTEDEEHLAQLETEFLTTLSLSPMPISPKVSLPAVFVVIVFFLDCSERKR